MSSVIRSFPKKIALAAAASLIAAALLPSKAAIADDGDVIIREFDLGSCVVLPEPRRDHIEFYTRPSTSGRDGTLDLRGTLIYTYLARKRVLIVAFNAAGSTLYEREVERNEPRDETFETGWYLYDINAPGIVRDRLMERAEDFTERQSINLCTTP